MIMTGAGTVTELDVRLTFGPAGDITMLECWDDTVPTFGVLSAIQTEPRRWWIFASEADVAPLMESLGEYGAITPIGSGIALASLVGPGWREILMIGGWFDAEAPDFATGATAGTLLGHVSVRLNVVSAEQCDVYFGASYLEEMQHHWHRFLEGAD